MPPLVQTVQARIDGRIRRQTAAGVGFQYGKSILWLPKSQLFGIEYDVGGDSEEVRIGRMVRTVEIPGWLAREKGLEEVGD